jgi:hypothetical protein
LEQLVQLAPRAHEVLKVQAVGQVRRGLQVHQEQQLQLFLWLLAIPIAVLAE